MICDTIGEDEAVFKCSTCQGERKKRTHNKQGAESAQSYEQHILISYNVKGENGLAELDERLFGFSFLSSIFVFVFVSFFVFVFVIVPVFRFQL